MNNLTSFFVLIFCFLHVSRILSTLCKTNLNFAHWYAFPFNVMSELIRNAFFFHFQKRKTKLQNKGRFLKESCRTDPNSVINLPMITYKERVGIALNLWGFLQ